MSSSPQNGLLVSFIFNLLNRLHKWSLAINNGKNNTFLVFTMYVPGIPSITLFNPHKHKVGAIIYSHFRVEEMGWERSGDLPKLTLVVRADPSQCEHQRVYNEWVCPFHRIPLGCWIQTLIRLSLLTTFLKSHSRRIQSWGSSIQGGPCFKIQQRSDMEVENGSEGGDKAASRPLNQAVEGITVMITVQGTPQEEQVWGTVGRMNLKVRSVGTSRHSDVLQDIQMYSKQLESDVNSICAWGVTGTEMQQSHGSDRIPQGGHRREEHQF